MYETRRQFAHMPDSIRKDNEHKTDDHTIFQMNSLILSPLCF